MMNSLKSFNFTRLSLDSPKPYYMHNTSLWNLFTFCVSVCVNIEYETCCKCKNKYIYIILCNPIKQCKCK
jgi:hypothetical protein